MISRSPFKPNQRELACVAMSAILALQFSANVVNCALAGAAGLVASAFALSTFDRWLRRRQPHELAWSIAMALFSIGSLALWWAESTGWTIAVFRLFFLCGAVLNVAWLSLGTVYLLAGRTVGDIVRTWLIAATGFAVGIVVVSPAKAQIIRTEFPEGREIFGAAPRILAAIGSGLPALVIITGALWSTWRVLFRKTDSRAGRSYRTVKSPGRVALGNIVVAAGTLILSASGLIAGRLGQDRAFALTLLIGVCALFGGFLIASNSMRERSVQLTTKYLAGTSNG